MKSTCSSCPVADVICRTIELGLTIEGAFIGEGDITIIQARPIEAIPFCPKCGAEGVLRDHITRELTDLPVAGHPSRLHVRLPRYRCVGERCPQQIFQHRLECAEVGAKTTNRCTRWILQKLSASKMSVKAVAGELGLGWDLVNRLALTSVRSLVYDDPTHLDGVRVLGVDEHCWSHVRGRGKETYATILVDLTPVIEGTGSSRLLDVRPGRSKKVLATWLKERTPAFRDGIEVVTMDGFAGYHSATVAELPEAISVMDPFHVVQLAGEKVTTCRQRLQQAITGHRGRKDDPLYKVRKTLLTRRGLLTERQHLKVANLWQEHTEHVALEVTYMVYQDIIDAYAHPKRSVGKRLMRKVMGTIRKGLPAGLEELAQLGRTLWRKRKQVLAFFDHGGASNGPVEAINGRLEHLRGIALGFRNFDHYVLRCLIHSGQLTEKIKAL